MGTRGIIGVRIDGVDKVTYNHSDSYPDGAGIEVYKALLDPIFPNLEKFKQLARDVKMVESDGQPTAEEIKKFEKYFAQVSSGTVNEYYALLRGLQGNLVGTLESGLMIEYRSFAFSSLFCEWGYIINLDDLVFETYKGFQTTNHKKGRFGLEYPAWLRKQKAAAKAEEKRTGQKSRESLDGYTAIALVHTQQITPKMPKADAWLKKIVQLTADKEA